MTEFHGTSTCRQLKPNPTEQTESVLDSRVVSKFREHQQGVEMVNVTQSTLKYYNNFNNDLYNAYVAFIDDNGPYAYSVTVTFRTSQNRIQCESQIKFFIKALNYKLFGRSRIKNEQASIHGVYVLEESSTYSNNPYHMHMLIRSDALTENTRFEEMETKFNLVCDCIQLNCNRKQAIGERCIRLGYSDNCTKYVLKACKDQNTFDETLIELF
jgi:hypothetical protein